MAGSDAKITVAGVERELMAMRALAEALEPLDKDGQLRVLEAACVLLDEDWFARAFRRIRVGPAKEG